MSEDKITIIRPEGPAIHSYLREAWKRRYLAWLFAKRELKVLYSNTYLGVIWAIINPLLTVLILTFVFQKIGDIESHGIAPFTSTLLAYFAWGMLSNLVNHSSESIASVRNLVHKVYFPRILLTGSGLFINMIESVIIVIALLISSYFLINDWHFNFWIFIIGLLSSISVAIGLALCVSAIVLRFKDLKYTIPFALRLGIFITPIGFQGIHVPDKWLWTLYVNPISGPIEVLRYGLFDYPISNSMINISLFWALLLLIAGLVLISKIDYRVADLI
jgi:lipopolysaccharide transport system permease protein